MGDMIVATMWLLAGLLIGVLGVDIAACMMRTGDVIRPVSARKAQKILAGLVVLVRHGAMRCDEAVVQYRHEVGALRASFLYPRGYEQALEWAFVAFMREQWDRDNPGDRQLNPWGMP